MDISIVVPFYNAERYIEDCIKALLSQNYPTDRYEIIMVDNNSADKSAEIVKRYPPIKLLSAHRQGSYSARNRGIAESKGASIAFTDADCSPSPDWLQNIATVMLCPDVGIVLGRWQFASKSGLHSMLAAYEAEKAAYVFSGNTKESYYGYTNNMAVRRALFDRLGPFLEIARGADTIFVRRVVDQYSCEAVRYSPDVCVRHLEITGAWKWYRKMLVYGESYQNYHKIVPARRLTRTERLRIFTRTVQKQQYSLPKSALFFLLIVVGGVCYKIGQRRATEDREPVSRLPPAFHA